MCYIASHLEPPFKYLTPLSFSASCRRITTAALLPNGSPAPVG